MGHGKLSRKPPFPIQFFLKPTRFLDWVKSMQATCSCPPVRDLQRLVHAQVSGQEAQSLRRHLDQCSRCLEILHTFEEGLVPAGPMEKAPIPQAGDPSGTWRRGQRPAMAALSRVKSALEPGTGPAAEPAPSVPAILAASPSRPLIKQSPESTQELLNQMAPPQGADELARVGSYRVLRALGSGATGVVFLAEDTQLRRQVALKVMKPVPEANDLARQRFLREAQAAAVIDHEHIVTIYQVGEDAGVPFLAMKLLQGETLDEKLKRQGQLMIHEILQIGRQIAEGLDAAHEQGLIHRDIKPANIFLEGGSRVKIVDFGLARAVSDDLHLTRTGMIVGTPAYMSPEQARGARIDHRSDLFSLGCVLFRMCTGRPPFKADDTMGLLMALANDQPPPIKAFNPDVPDLLVGLICQLMAKLPEGRPQSARTVATALDTLANLVAQARNPSQLQWHRRQKAERPFWVTSLQMVILAGLGWAIYWYGLPVFQEVGDLVRIHFLK